jgi:putative hydrolase of the HAD superfamily
LDDAAIIPAAALTASRAGHYTFASLRRDGMRPSQHSNSWESLTEASAIQHLLIDLDDTVYPPGNGLWEQITGRIDAYMSQKLGLSAAEIALRRAEYVATFGTTLTGLMRDFSIEPVDYLEFVHQVDYRAVLKPDKLLRQALLSLPQAKAIFTNASRDHAEHVLAALGLQGVFNHILDIVSLGYVNKPMPEAYQRAVALVGADSPRACLMADDRAINLAPARDLGMTTVMVGPGASNQADVHLVRLADLPQALPELLRFPHATGTDQRG